MTGEPGRHPDGLVVRDLSGRHVAGLPHRSSRQTVARITGLEPFDPAARIRPDPVRHIDRANLTGPVVVVVVFIVGLPRVAVVPAVDIFVPTAAPCPVTLHVRLVVKETISAGAAIGHIGRHRRPVIVGQGPLTARFHTLRQGHRHHLVDRFLLRHMAADDLAVLFDGRPSRTGRFLVRNEIWHVRPRTPTPGSPGRSWPRPATVSTAHLCGRSRAAPTPRAPTPDRNQRIPGAAP